jgi:hypothetical protein
MNFQAIASAINASLTRVAFSDAGRGVAGGCAIDAGKWFYPAVSTGVRSRNKTAKKETI